MPESTPSTFVIDSWLAVTLASGAFAIMVATASAVWFVADFVTTEQHELLEQEVEKLRTQVSLLSTIEQTLKDRINSKYSRVEVDNKMSCLLSHINTVHTQSVNAVTHREFHSHIERELRFENMWRESIVNGAKLHSADKRAALFNNPVEFEIFLDWAKKKQNSLGGERAILLECI